MPSSGCSPVTWSKASLQHGVSKLTPLQQHIATWTVFGSTPILVAGGCIWGEVPCCCIHPAHFFFKLAVCKRSAKRPPDGAGAIANKVGWKRKTTTFWNIAGSSSGLPTHAPTAYAASLLEFDCAPDPEVWVWGSRTHPNPRSNVTNAAWTKGAKAKTRPHDNLHPFCSTIER